MAGETHKWRIDVVGKISLRHGDDEPVDLRPKERAVLAALAFADPDAVDADQITDLVWERDAPRTARKSVHNHIARIRAIDDALIETAPTGYRLGTDVVIDAAGASTGSDTLSEPFADLADTPEVEARRVHIRARAEARRDDELFDELREGATPSLLGRLHEAVVAEPYNERRWYLLALAQARLDQRRDSLRTLRLARGQLAEVGLTPGASIAELEASVLSGVESSAASMQRSRTALHAHAGEPFVGRRRELSTLSSVWEQTLERQAPHLVVVTGPSGIGKTRLVDRFASSTGHDDSPPTVVWGRCRQAGKVPHAALVEGAVAACHDDPRLAQRVGSALTTLVAVGDATPVDRTVLDDGTQHARHLALALGTFAHELSPRPAIWLIDDVQWMSDDSIDLLRQAIAGVRSPMLIIATERPAELAASAPSSFDLAIDTTRVTLSGLNVDEIAHLVSAWESTRTGPDSAHEDDSQAEAARILHERTAGHPLYATEIARRSRLAGEPIDPYAAPPALNQWVAERVAELSDDVATALRFAAVIGRHVEPSLLARCLDQPIERVVESCDAAAASGLLTSRGPVGLLEFSHAITCDTVYGLIGPSTVALLHARVCEVLEHSAAQPDHAVLAYHARRAGHAYRHRAAQHSLLAGQRHFAAGSWNDAGRHFQHALETDPDNTHVAEALSWLGRAQARQSRLDVAESTLRTAIARARLDGLPLVQAEATIALVGRAGRGAATDSNDDEQLSVVRAAITHLERRRPSTDQMHREATILMSSLERELAYGLLLTDQRAEREALLSTSLARVRALTPPPEQAVANAILATRYRKLSPADIHERLADIDEVLSMPPQLVGPETLLTALTYRIEELTRLGTFGAALDTAREAELVLERYPHPYWTWAVSTWRVVLDIATTDLTGGGLERAEQRAFHAFDARKTVDGAAACLAVNLVNVRLYQGRAHEMLGALGDAIEAHPELPVYRAVHALCAVTSGDTTAAANTLGWFTEAGFDAVPHDTNRLLALGVLGHVAADLGDVAASAELAELLRPFDGQWVVISCYGGGGAIWGSVAQTLRRLDELQLAPVS